MKKLLAIALALIMLFALSACNATGVEGKWEWTVKVDGEMMGVEDFDGSFTLVTLFEFGKDGAYTISVDEDALEESIEDFEDELVDYMVELMGDESYRSVAESTVKQMDLMGQMKKTIEKETGTYEIKEDVLILTPDDEDEDEQEYSFELDGDELILTGDDPDMKEFLELIGKKKVTLKRVK